MSDEDLASVKVESSTMMKLEKFVDASSIDPIYFDALNVFMCTGFSRNTHQYFMKASPARPGDYLEFFVEIDLLAALSACPGGDCGASHSDDSAKCYPLKVEIHRPEERALAGWRSPGASKYSKSHGI